MEMPGADFMGQSLADAVAKGTIAESFVDDAVLRILTPMFAVGVFDTPNANVRSANVTSEAHNDLARRLSAASTVLLKNDNDVLPLMATHNVAVVGWADSSNCFTHGTGSGAQRLMHLISSCAYLFANMNSIVGHERLHLHMYTCTHAYIHTHTLSLSPPFPLPSPNTHPPTRALTLHTTGKVLPSRIVSPLLGITNRVAGAGSVSYNNGSNIAQAVALAAAADVAIVFVGTTSGEGRDRESLSLAPEMDELIAAVAKVNPNTIVVVATPGMVLMPWAQAVPAILTNFMPGQEVGNAIADVLFGDVNPSGRLSFTMPNIENEQQMTQSQWPGLPASNPAVAEYSEGLFFGYRWYDQHNVNPLFPFGHGLSYTRFKYENLQLDPSRPRCITFDLINRGEVDGAEVWQLYLGFPPAAGEPPKVLRGFQKVQLAAGGRFQAQWTLTERDMSIWDVATHAWAPVSGNFTVFVGASSRDIRAQVSMVV
jgi:beta-glucosidase